MRFAARLTVALWLAIIAVLMVNGYDRYRREAALFESDMQRDHRVLGRGIGAAVAEVWEDEGRLRALEIVARANQRESGLEVRWVDIDAPAGEPAAPVAPALAIAPVRAGSSASWKQPGDPGYIYTYVPLQVDGERAGALEIAESLTAEAAYLEASMLRVALVTGSLAALAGAIAVVIGVQFVGRPIRLLVQKARRVGAGEFEDDLDLPARDELGELAREMNLMSRRLAAAREALAAETGSRLAAQEQLRHAERLVTVGKLAAGVAHELGTPLNVIAWRSRNVATGKVTGDEARENARVAMEQCDRITAIVRQLLDYARRRQPDARPVDLVALAEQSAGLLAPAAHKAGVTVAVRAARRPVLGHADASQVQQVLTNLYLNAIQAMPGGGDLRVEVDEVERPAPGEEAAARWVRVAVADTGVGVAPEHLPHLFDPFFTTKPVGEGTGLGLSVAWGIVREHGGWIDVESRPGEGARFAVFLPVEAR